MNNRLHLYSIPFIIVLIISILIVVQLYIYPIKEGLETRIIREDGKVIKRKKRKTQRKIREGIDWDPLRVGEKTKQLGNKAKSDFDQLTATFNKVTDTFNEVTNGFNRMFDFFKKIGNIFNFIPTFFKYLASFIVRVFNNISTAFNYIPRVFLWLGSYLNGAMKFVINFPKCFKWYSLETLGHILYAPLKFLFWLFSLQSTEDMLWGIAEDFDCTVKKYTGYNLIHYSNDIQQQCYTFCPEDFPKFPNLDWSFNPPTIDIRF